MKEVKIYGYSHDLVEIEIIDDGAKVDGQSYEAGNGSPYKGTVVLSYDLEDSVMVFTIYNGNWSFAIAPNEEEHLPDWCEIRSRSWGKDTRYSETVVLGVPDSTIVTWEEDD